MKLVILIPIVSLFISSCYDKKLGEKTFTNKDITVSWHYISEITSVHDFVDVIKGSFSKNIFKCNTDEIYDISIQNDSIIIRTTKKPTVYEFTDKVFDYHVKIDSTISTYKWLKKYRPESAEAFKDKADSDTLGIKQILISSGQISAAKEVVINNHKFDLVVRNTDTLYLSTNDEEFITPEGYRVGMKLSVIHDDLIQKLKKESGWGYYIQLPSNWCLGFCEGNSCTDTPPSSSSKIKWIFKRNK